jgi:hypothetical protein
MSATVNSVSPVSPFRFLGRSLILDVALPWLTVRILEAYGVSTVWALAAAAVFPGGSIVFSWVCLRRVEAIGIAVFITILLGIAMALISDEVRFGLVKAAPAFGLFGLVCLASLLAPRPLMFFVARHFQTGGDPAKAAEWNGRMEIRAFAMPCGSSPRSGALFACWRRCWDSRPRSCCRCTPRSWRSRRSGLPASSGC